MATQAQKKIAFKDQIGKKVNTIHETSDILVKNPAPQIKGSDEVTASIKKEFEMEQKKLREEDPEVNKLAENFLSQLLDPNTTNNDRRNAIDDLGINTQRESTHRSRLLQERVKELAAAGDDGGPVAKGLVDLTNTVQNLDPAHFDFSDGWLVRMVGYVPLLGMTVKKFLQRYLTAQTMINQINEVLDNGKERLRNDNETMSTDQDRYREVTKKLMKIIEVARALDDKMTTHVESMDPESEEAKFLKSEILAYLKTRVLDLQQQLVVNQQGVVSTELLIRNNRDLIRAVNRCQMVTVKALEIGVATAVALGHQKKVLKAVQSANKVGDDILVNNAHMLRTTGAEIQKTAFGTMLNIESIKRAMADTSAAIADVENFRINSLAQLSQNIQDMGELTEEGERQIKRLEKGTAAQQKLVLDLPSEAA